MSVLQRNQNSPSPPSSKTCDVKIQSNPDSVSSSTLSNDYLKRHSVSHVAYNHNAPSRDPSIERRGRPAKRDVVTFMRPPELVKNIQTSQSDLLVPTFTRSRDASAHTLHLQTSSDTQHDKRQTKVQHRTSRFKHPMNAYAVDSTTFETIVPHHSSMLQQKYSAKARTNSSRSSVGNTTLATDRSSRPSVSVPMGGDLVPAFDDMNMDMDGQEEEGLTATHIEYGSSHGPLSATDATFASLPLNSQQEPSTKEVKKGSPKSTSTHHQVGRIQQRIQALKALKEDEDNSWNSGYHSVEQKTLLDSLNYDLHSMKRFNYRPLISSLERVSKIELEKPLPQPSSSLEEEAGQYVKAFHPLITDLRLSQAKSSVSSKKAPLNTGRLEQLVRKSSEVTKSLWVDTNGPRNSTGTTQSSQATYSKDMDLQTITHGNEVDRIQEHFSSFSLNHSAKKLAPLNTTDPSPKTNRV